MHYTIRVYPNGDIVLNTVACEHIATHIRYNMDMRPGTSLIVDGNVIKSGNGVTPELEQKAIDTKYKFSKTPTFPYK